VHDAAVKVAVTGSHGLIGTALIERLQRDGHEVLRLVRRTPAASGEIAWDPDAGTIDGPALEGVDAVVHLAGEGVGDRRWTAVQKARILDSRVRGTTTLSTALAALATKPAVFVSGSAVGFYGGRGDEVLTEDAGTGEGFLAEVVRDWEAATAPAVSAGIRVVLARTGIVLSRRGGALKRQLPLFRFGVGGRLGSGRFWMSWISIDDEVGALLHAIGTPSLSGPVNLVAPNPVTNATFTKALGRALHRPAALVVPRFALNVALGRELADNLLASQRVAPVKLEASGYRFVHPTIDEALHAVV
jgi:uncharacterized protein (TIGR01777 family)